MTYKVTTVRNGVLVGKLVNVEGGIAEIVVERGRRFLYRGRLVQKGDVVHVPIALTLFEEVEE